MTGSRRSPGRYEPEIVTTLRLYVRRRAPASLLLRIAGGARCWRLLNEWWNLDGRLPPREPLLLGVPVPALSPAERRIALEQIADEFAEAAAPLPPATVLAQHFGVPVGRIKDDFRTLRQSGRLAWHLASDGVTGVRRFPRSQTVAAAE